MGLNDVSIQDLADISSNLNDWGMIIDLTSPNGDTLSVGGFHTKHHMSYDEGGAIVNHKHASVAVSELNLGNYPVRDVNGEVDLLGHKVFVNDSTGIQKKYLVQQAFPDEKLGLIVLILSDFI